MFDIGFGELLLIAVVALVVLGPERLPKAARTLGTLLRRMRSGWESVRAEVEREIEAEELKQKLQEAQEYMRQAGRDVDQQVRESTESVRQAAQDVSQSAMPGRAAEAADLDDEDIFERDLFAETEAGSGDAKSAPAPVMKPIANASGKPKSPKDASGEHADEH